MTVLQTERLTLRPLVAADAEPYAGMRYHPEVARWLPPAAAGADPGRGGARHDRALRAGVGRAPLRPMGHSFATAG